MKTPILVSGVVLTLSLGALTTANAGSATWNAQPVDDNWTNPDNWTPATVPNGPGDTATFGVSGRTNVSIRAPIEVNSIVFTPGASAFTITPKAVHGNVLTISGAGIENDSGIIQNFVTSSAENTRSGIIFNGFATAGNQTVVTNNGGAFGGHTDFYDNASAGSAVVINNGGSDGAQTTFWDNSTAADATLIANGASPPDVFGGRVWFESPNTGNATLVANGGDNNGGFILIKGGGSNLTRIELHDNSLFFTGYNSDLAIGSIEGDGQITIAYGFTLRVGNNLSTVFSGVIQDDTPPILASSSVPGPMHREGGGTLAKVGTGVLTLTGNNTYSSGTKVTAGTLVVANTDGSGTGGGPVLVTSGRLGGSGIIAGATTIGTGSGSGALLAPAAGTNVQATLTIQSGLTFNADATYTYTFKANRNRVQTDTVVANGVTINSGAMIELTGQIRGILAQATVLTLISNTSADPMIGAFSNLADGSIVTINGNNFQASYEGGDGNDLTLTVVP